LITLHTSILTKSAHRSSID